MAEDDGADDVARVQIKARRVIAGELERIGVGNLVQIAVERVGGIGEALGSRHIEADAAEVLDRISRIDGEDHIVAVLESRGGDAVGIRGDAGEEHRNKGNRQENSNKFTMFHIDSPFFALLYGMQQKQTFTGTLA